MNEKMIQEYLTENHSKIEGWFFPNDMILFIRLLLLQFQTGITGDLCEVGVYRGKSLALMSLLRSENERALGFDLFVDDDEHVCIDNLKKFGDFEKIELYKGLTSEISNSMLEKHISSPLRFLHIDAGHEYHEVLEQLEIFAPFVSRTGIIVMDDFQDRDFPGVSGATFEFCNRFHPRRFVPFLAGGNKMYLCEPSAAILYQRSIAESEQFRDKCRVTKVKDYTILIAPSKLPVESKRVISLLEIENFPLYEWRAENLKESAVRYSQIRFGRGQ